MENDHKSPICNFDLILSNNSMIWIYGDKKMRETKKKDIYFLKKSSWLKKITEFFMEKELTSFFTEFNILEKDRVNKIEG